MCRYLPVNRLCVVWVGLHSFPREQLKHKIWGSVAQWVAASLLKPGAEFPLQLVEGHEQ